MKYLKIFQILFLCAGMLLLFSACGEISSTSEHDDHSEDHAEAHDAEADHDHDHDHEAAHDHDLAMHGEGKTYTSAYVCPMHCEGSGSEEAGECPVCGMTYVAQADHVADGHTHE